MGEYQCPWCGSKNTDRHTHSYVNHFIKGVASIGGRFALAAYGAKQGFAGQATSASDRALEDWFNKDCYDYFCNDCGKDFYVYKENYKLKKISKYRQ